jgi:hypothetical protein
MELSELTKGLKDFELQSRNLLGLVNLEFSESISKSEIWDEFKGVPFAKAKGVYLFLEPVMNLR